MKLQEVSRTCFAVLNEKNRVCDANSGLINAGGGMVIDTQSDFPHARQMIELFGKIWTEMPKRVVNTHEDGDHVWGNQLFHGAQIIGHRSLPERMRQVAEPAETQKLTRAAGGRLTGLLLKFLHPGVAAADKQPDEDYDFEVFQNAYDHALLGEVLGDKLRGTWPAACDAERAMGSPLDSRLTSRGTVRRVCRMRERRPLPRGLVPAVIFVALATVAPAQDPDLESDATVQQELRALRDNYRDLVLRLSELEGENRVQGDGAEEEEYLYDEDDDGGGLTFRAGDVDGTFLIFGDVRASYENPASGGNSEFDQGALDIVGNVNFGDNFRVLSETVIETDKIGQERLWGQYIVNDALYFKLGTEHSPMVRWNYEFHHGAWLETTITRPILDRFEGGGGILPMHRTGLETGGTLFTGGGSLQYFATVSNGRGMTPKDKQRDGDLTDAKAIDVGLNYSPAGSPRMTFGGALTFDAIPADATVVHPDRGRDMTEWIATGNFSSGLGALFLRSEYAFILHEGRATGRDYTHNAGFLQLELPREQWTPYARTGYRNMQEGDPFYSPLDRDLDEWRQTIGVRNDFHTNVAIKFEASYGRRDERSGVDISGDGIATVGIQIAWYF